jgi:hypothetical protein
MIARRIASEHRATASRASNAKSRGPVTVKGKANSSPDSLRQGLRAAIDSYASELKPQSMDEHLVVKSLATSGDRQTAIAGLERTVPNERAFDRLQELQAWSELEAELAEKLNIDERTREIIENTWLSGDASPKEGGRESAENRKRAKQILTNEPQNSLKTDHQFQAPAKKRTHGSRCNPILKGLHLYKS